MGGVTETRATPEGAVRPRSAARSTRRPLGALAAPVLALGLAGAAPAEELARGPEWLQLRELDFAQANAVVEDLRARPAVESAGAVQLPWDLAGLSGWSLESSFDGEYDWRRPLGPWRPASVTFSLEKPGSALLSGVGLGLGVERTGGRRWGGERSLWMELSSSHVREGIWTRSDWLQLTPSVSFYGTDETGQVGALLEYGSELPAWPGLSIDVWCSGTHPFGLGGGQELASDWTLRGGLLLTLSSLPLPGLSLGVGFQHEWSPAGNGYAAYVDHQAGLVLNWRF